MKHINLQASSPDRMETNPGRDRQAKWQHILTSRLDEGDLRLLCIHLGIDFYYLPGEKKDEKTDALIDLLERQGRVPELLRAVLLLHPEIPWKRLLNISHYPSWVRRFVGRLNKSLPAIILLIIICALFVFIPLSSATWIEVLGVTGDIFVGSWSTTNCTYSQDYWKEHPDAWPVEGVTIGEVTSSIDEATAVLETLDQGDATYILARQLIAAKLNILNGADANVVEVTIQDADSWLVEHDLGSNPQNPAQEFGTGLANVLELYNTGAVGPGSCSEAAAIIPGLPIEKDLPIIFPVLPELTPSQTASAESDGGTIAKNTPLPPATEAPSEGAPVSPTLAPTMGIDPTQSLPPSETPRPTPTLAPTQGLAPTPTSTPIENIPDTPTLAPTDDASTTSTPTVYAGPPGCTQPMEYWMVNHNDWLLDEFNFGEVAYDQAAAIEILETKPQGDATYMLTTQYITALLNIASPADPTAVAGVLEQAQIWFTGNPLGSDPKNPGRKAGIQIADALEEYNAGSVGPGICEQLVSITTPTSTSTPLPTQTPSGSVTPTLAPTPEVTEEPAP